MNPYPSRFGAVVAININSLLAFAFGWSSWFMWPDRPEWWGLGLLCIINGIVAVSLAGTAVKVMARLYRRDKTIQLYMAQGRAPKSSEMVSVDQLERAGMR